MGLRFGPWLAHDERKRKKTLCSPKTLVLVFAYVDYCSNEHP